MKKLRSVTAGAIATAMLATSATPALAQGYSGYGYGQGYGYPGYGDGDGYGYDDYRYRDYRHRHRNRGSDAGAVIAGVAVIGIIAALAASASRRNSAQQSWNGRTTARIDSEDAAASACAAGAEQRLSSGARTTDIDDVQRTGEGYTVRGRVELNQRSDRDRQSFTCTVRYGAVERIDFGSYAFNY